MLTTQFGVEAPWEGSTPAPGCPAARCRFAAVPLREALGVPWHLTLMTRSPGPHHGEHNRSRPALSGPVLALQNPDLLLSKGGLWPPFSSRFNCKGLMVIGQKLEESPRKTPAVWPPLRTLSVARRFRAPPTPFCVSCSVHPSKLRVSRGCASYRLRSQGVHPGSCASPLSLPLASQAGIRSLVSPPGIHLPSHPEGSWGTDLSAPCKKLGCRWHCSSRICR